MNILRETKICILVYDITYKESFESLDYWIDFIKEVLGDKPILGIVRKKCDLFEQKVIDEQEGRQYAQNIGALFSLSSSKEYAPGFSNLMGGLIEKYVKQNKLDEDKKGIKLDPWIQDQGRIADATEEFKFIL